MKNIKLLSLLVIILFTFTALSACGKPATAQELVEKVNEASSEVTSYSADVTVGGSDLDINTSVEVVLDPETAYKASIEGYEITYVDGKLYVGDKETSVDEETLTAINDRMMQGFDSATLESLIIQDSVTFEENDESYTLGFNLDPVATKDFITEKIESSVDPAVLEKITAATSVSSEEPPNISECSLEFEVDEKTYLISNWTASVSLASDTSSEFSIYASMVYDEVDEIKAPTAE